MGTLTRWERAKKQSPESQGNVFVLSAPSCPWDYKLHKAKPSLLPMGFSKAQCLLSMEQVWAVERARRRKRNVESIFSLLAELFDLDIAFLRITESLIK